jgi:hypothetical protein
LQPQYGAARFGVPGICRGELGCAPEDRAAAHECALECRGRQLVDLLIEHWGDIPPEFRERLGLKPGLVRV